METLCGANCDNCGSASSCKGCVATGGHPFGGACIAADYIAVGGRAAFEAFKRQLMAEFNALNIEGMPKIDQLYCLHGAYINLKYPLVNGTEVSFLEDNNIYLGTQVDCEFVDRCFGLVADTSFLLVCEYGENGTNPEIVLYKRR